MQKNRRDKKKKRCTKQMKRTISEQKTRATAAENQFIKGT